jgi:Family of unknown function (DUF6174)
MKKIIYILFVLSLISCNDREDNSIITVPIDENYSNIKDPQKRWQAYHLNNYTITETQYCECPAPNIWEALIYNNSVEYVKYEIPKNAYHNRTEDEIYSQTKNRAITIDEAFALIQKYKDTAYKVIKYDSRFGYPTRIFIDIDSLMADEEIIREFDNLEKVIN